MAHRPVRAFTLIELLVVITIIVVLLTLLTPALDKAVYRAEFTTCAARLKSMSSGILTYATEQRRFYPYRNLESTFWQQFVMLADPNNHYDPRRSMKPYLSFKSFVDPLTGAIKVGPEDTHPDSEVLLPYEMWFGSGFT